MIDKILEDREERYNRILELIEKHNLPVVCAKVNYPGTDKNTKEAKMAFEALRTAINEGFKREFIYTTFLNGYDGQSMLGVINKDEMKTKNIGVKIEEQHNLGRIFDIDIYTKDGSSLGREKVGKSQRECIVCGQDARICIKLGNHSQLEVLSKLNKMIKSHFKMGV